MVYKRPITRLDRGTQCLIDGRQTSYHSSGLRYSMFDRPIIDGRQTSYHSSGPRYSMFDRWSSYHSSGLSTNKISTRSTFYY